MDDLFEAVRRVAKGLTGESLPYCYECYQFHKLGAPCIEINCPMCGTKHLPNKFQSWKNCTVNETFKRKLRAHEEWCRKNTAEIWAQPDKEKEEEE